MIVVCARANTKVTSKVLLRGGNIHAISEKEKSEG